MPHETKPLRNWQPLSFSSVLAEEDSVYAASMGHGVYSRDGSGIWNKITGDAQGPQTVNRMKLYGEKLYTCTDEGLWSYSQGEWEREELEVPCYQIGTGAGCRYAATAEGLWSSDSGSGGSWEMAAYPRRRVFDFLNVPHFLILAHDQGIALYDRLTDSWSDFNLGLAVTSLAVYRGHLVGAAGNGGLIVGNKRGGFNRILFPKTRVFKVIPGSGGVLLCTDKGLYRYGALLGQAALFSVRLGGPVTDASLQDGYLYMATLFEGIKVLPAD